MLPFMKNILIPVLVCTGIIVLGSCKIGGALRDFHSISRNIDEVSSTMTPVDSLVMDATSGLLTELSSENSQEKLDSITARINRNLTKYLTQMFQELDPAPFSNKFSQGVLDPFLAEETELRMKKLISALSDQMSHDIAKSITSLTSPANKAKLNSLLASFFSEANSKMLSSFINRSLRDIEFDTLGNRMANELIAKNLKPQMDTVIRTAVKAVFDGEVSAVNNIEDMQMVVLKHGGYFSAYSNLSGVNLSRGQVIHTGQVIGRVAVNDEGVGSIDLIISNDKSNLNPESWLKRR